jgi:hypothetical protein
MDNSVHVQLSQDQALVLFELFARFQESNRLGLTNNAEFIALSEVAAQIESALVQPFSPHYGELLAEAQARLGEGYEGLAPGVEPMQHP